MKKNVTIIFFFGIKQLFTKTYIFNQKCLKNIRKYKNIQLRRRIYEFYNYNLWLCDNVDELSLTSPVRQQATYDVNIIKRSRGNVQHYRSLGTERKIHMDDKISDVCAPEFTRYATSLSRTGNVASGKTKGNTCTGKSIRGSSSSTGVYTTVASLVLCPVRPIFFDIHIYVLIQVLHLQAIQWV